LTALSKSSSAMPTRTVTPCADFTPPDPRRRGRVARQRKTPPRSGLGFGNSQGCVRV